MSKNDLRIPKKAVIAVSLLLLAGLGNWSFQTSIRGAGTADLGGFAGSASCASCHKDIYLSHIQTAHYHDSRPPSSAGIRGSFAPPANRFHYNRFTDVVMEQTDSGFFQTAYINGAPFRKEAFGMVIGSGRKGQSYLYWQGDRLFQLPISYYTPLSDWCISPGYNPSMVYFNKAIPGRCIECHGTYARIDATANGPALFDSSSIIYGIDCERCHGPAAAHVAFQQANPDQKTARYIINPALLTRKQRLDACALCHSGFRDEKRAAFSFQVGDDLDEFSRAIYQPDSSAALDVHGNQYGLLTASKCFRRSQMDCSSCHQVHRNEVNDPRLFSARCMQCHEEHTANFCSLVPAKGVRLSDNCIDCHMPLLASKKIILQMNDPKKSAADLVRTHRIAIYR